MFAADSLRLGAVFALLGDSTDAFFDLLFVGFDAPHQVKFLV
jgi:hypothetical protein